MVTANSGHHAIIPLHVTRFIEPCRTPFCPIATAKDPDTPLPRELPFHFDEDNILASNETPTIVTNTATPIPLCGMIQITDDAPISLVSALEFERTTRTSEATTYLCVFRAINDDYTGSNDLSKIRNSLNRSRNTHSTIFRSYSLTNCLTNCHQMIDFITRSI